VPAYQVGDLNFRRFPLTSAQIRSFAQSTPRPVAFARRPPNALSVATFSAYACPAPPRRAASAPRCSFRASSCTGGGSSCSEVGSRSSVATPVFK